jgi:hypothetical protein
LEHANRDCRRSGHVEHGRVWCRLGEAAKAWLGEEVGVRPQSGGGSGGAAEAGGAGERPDLEDLHRCWEAHGIPKAQWPLFEFGVEPDFRARLAQIERTGGCSGPIRQRRVDHDPGVNGGGGPLLFE